MLVSAGEADGRTLRRIHSYERAVDAVLSLITEGVDAPTAQQIADRSGISLRTVFRLTDDVESLHAAAVQRQTERIASLYTELPTTGFLDERIGALVENRAALFEAITPVRRVGERLAPSSVVIAQGLARHRRMLRAQLASVFAGELSSLTDDCRGQVLHAADVAASWGTWDQLRRCSGLSRKESMRVVRRLLGGVFGPAGCAP
jgi:AcrR family transcriptional regulator